MDLWQTLIGNGTAKGDFVIFELRLPRVAAGLGGGFPPEPERLCRRVTRVDIRDVQVAMKWLTGNLINVDIRSCILLAVVVFVLMATIPWLERPLNVLMLGDDTARGLGTRPNRARAVIGGVGVVLGDVSAAVVGPSLFVEFASGPIARKLCRGEGPALFPASLVGAALALYSDLLAHFAVGAVQFPVGVVTALIGAPYFVLLLRYGDRARS